MYIPSCIPRNVSGINYLFLFFSLEFKPLELTRINVSEAILIFQRETKKKICGTFKKIRIYLSDKAKSSSQSSPFSVMWSPGNTFSV